MTEYNNKKNQLSGCRLLATDELFNKLSTFLRPLNRHAVTTVINDNNFTFW